MKGRVVKRAKDSWTLKYDAPRINGKRQQKSKTIKGTKKQADAELARIIHELETGQYADPKKQTVEEYLSYWLETKKRPEVKPNTFMAYERSLRRHVLPTLGSTSLPRLETHQLEHLYATLRKGGLSATFVRWIHAVLYDAFRQAVRWKMLNRNPAEMEQPPQGKSPKPKPLTQEQLRQVLAGAVGLPLHGPITVMAYLGLRPGETLALHWEDVDFAAGTLTVSRTLARNPDGGQCFQTPKSETSRRTLPLPGPVRAVLLAAPRLAGCPLVFPGPAGAPRWPQTLRTAWSRLLVREGLAHCRLHDIRHTHSALLLQQKTPIRVVQERLGHSDPAITLRIYGHLLPGMQDEAGKTIEDLLRPGAIDASKNPM